ncbi:LLM class flavin-dependent oxidoreductase [Prochlorococcus sp. MIT 0604]|uniref:LLM class flavin-dependent oxidoreductase n=1 Tax=Prochlorococcus sp. MIT 0604 TaxID=1501268 RepID=UPI0004F6946E|nr:LLM class flavin-dependent oxidoreductase [Prochlorococcus sp. MIT 0604]AIQ95520.1 hypothetical protein EW14_1509 [Prochlorococcus sp. MIT 0604]
MKQIGLFVIPIKVDESISTYNDYIDFLVEAEQKGYTHVYIGEHLTDEKEDIQSSLIFASALLARTTKINVCFCVLPLPHYEIKLLVKQLEDIYRLSCGRIQIGFSQGALKSDAEYLNFDHFKRGEIFQQKLDLFMNEIKKSKYLKKLFNESYFSTLLSPIPLKASNLFENGYSAITSNFVNEVHWDNHITCLNKNKIHTKNASKWHLSLNLVPYENLDERSLNSIKESLLYIYEKLSSCKLNVMLKNKNDILEELNIKDRLLKEMTYSEFPKKYFQLKNKYKNQFSYPIINLFDCIKDLGYTNFILDLPSNGNF